MTTKLLGLLMAVAACGGTIDHDTMPTAYTCDGATVDIIHTATLDRRGDDADRFVAANGEERIEYTIPKDRLQDATVTRYRGQAALGRSRCNPHGGYTDVLSRYLRTSSAHAVAVELKLDDEETRERIRRGWYRLGNQFRKEH